MKQKAKPRIASLREKAGLTQLELSRLVGVTESTIQNWESGRSGIDQIERIIKFCKALNCQLEDLIEYVNQYPEELAAKPSSLSEIHNLLGTDESSSIKKSDSQDAQQHRAKSKTV
ncbi:helix-turn-helix domain-containing protein [Aetokthonos hydrillicola Thurmond2011]|uniref:Helix-turn-helix domain-containing protein n=1 Tax=Aetokthonos hydrillicola Thurmond2011 TaxID=2712845 RepID=A0AAP5IB06_9CYAN|nr:helix-turn-helix transcriptional regulator [Aetokthonos hydrillicola]MBO3463443.1 helix-turn-helix transcriptional regulator [Aetokthonos hydrillicola CCALA 1050]MBW4588948.1 helix-turn-helix domain-containing protein [Aetokthonos hydrillicola CCALA 1050]MDR9898225.1 helix-turn-helix domain-containing protein [Aetokthonos hydrillicola Thurmond2011]